jgi:hypothetical protein
MLSPGNRNWQPICPYCNIPKCVAEFYHFSPPSVEEGQEKGKKLKQSKSS